MTAPADIAANFESAIAAFTPIVSSPIDDDLRNVRQILLQICLSIDLAGSKSGKATGVILGNVAYLTQPGVKTSLDEDQDPLEEYDPAIDENTKAWEQRKLTALWRTRLEN